MQHIELEVNGEKIQIEVKPTALLLETLRVLRLRGAKRGCESSHCGCCTVLMNGEAVHSCVVLAAQAQGKEVTTIEGLSKDGKLDDLQNQFLKFGALQCGYCTPGMILASKALLAKNKSPSLEDVKDALDGNLCRCTGYTAIFQAVLACAEMQKHKEG
jgi:aerobic carbon-monoxide dehydrogenase small subunit